MPPSVVLVTGVSRFLGGHLAARLAADPVIDRVLGVDTVPPPRDLLRRMGRAEFVRADIRNPLIAKVIARAEVDTVVHASLIADPARAGGRTAMKEMNVIGTMQLLAACQKAPSVRRMVLKCTTAVYGSSPRDPALFTEDDDARRTLPVRRLRQGRRRDRGLRARVRPPPARRRRSPCCGSPTSSARASTPPLTRYFALPVVPTVLGYDARLQLLHEEDALAVLTRAAQRGASPASFNVAADGVLLLSQAIRRAGRVPLPVPGARGRRRQPGCSAGAGSPTSRRSRCGSSTSAGSSTPPGCATQFGFTPRWTTVQAFDDFVRGRALRPVLDPSASRRRARCSTAGHAAAAVTAGLEARRHPAPARRRSRPVAEATGHPAARRRRRRARGRWRPRRPARPAPSPPEPARRRRPRHAGPDRALRRSRPPTSPTPRPTRAEPPPWEQQLAGALAFLRRRLDRRLRGRRLRLRPRPHRQRPAAAAAPALPEVVPGRDDRPGQRPRRRRRAGRRQPLRHHPAGRADDLGRAARPPPGAPAPAACSAPTWSSGCRCVGAAGPQGRQHAGLQRRRGAAAGRRRAGRRSGPEGFKGIGKPFSRPLQAAAVRPRRLRLRGAAHRHADHPVLDRRAPRRSTR